jgi:signal transduction histidine kinase
VRHGKKVTEISFFAYFSNQHLVISIRDDGVGISQDEKGLIFTRGYGKNTGLGLYLSREILSITGITIRETGEEGKGAVFELVIPPQGYRIMRMKTDTSSESKTATDVQHGIES